MGWIHTCVAAAGVLKTHTDYYSYPLQDISFRYATVSLRHLCDIYARVCALVVPTNAYAF